MPRLPILLCLGCALAVAGLLHAERHDRRRARAVFKLAASTAFVLLALSLHATASAYGQVVLLALALSWIGDACLLAERDAWFLAGLGAFLLAHIAFSAAFAFGASIAPALAAGALPIAVVGFFVLRWLWPRLDAFHRFAVGSYVLAILVMCTLALARSTAGGSWIVAAGAFAFAASDLSVARDRFVAPGFSNRAWGLPLYFAAQLLLAASVA
ncbi:MAG: lysoplasmalogenase [Burkholderiales bacterium]|nr:lysoplasmalogenase [Burkholderiales bacterium]